jgi:hypothetical protein
LSFSDTGDENSGEKSDDCSSASVDQLNTTTRDTGVVNVCGDAPPLESQASGRLNAHFAWRLGMHSDAWVAIIGALSPTAMVLVTALHTQAGLILGSLIHNDSRFGLAQCPLVCFHPHGLETTLHLNKPADQRKYEHAAHAADHVLSMVYKSYIAFQEDVKGGTLSRTGRSPRRLGRTASIASVDAVGDDTANGAVLNLGLGPYKYIQVPRNYGRQGVACTIAGRTDEDSDDAASGGTACSMDTDIMTKRNALAGEKYGVYVKASKGKQDCGNGLFAAKDLNTGHEIIVKGPIFESEPCLTKWIDDQPPLKHDFI